MKTKLIERGKLSQGQITRVGGLIAMACGRIPYQHILNDLIENQLLVPIGNGYELTERGRNELTRLTAMAGLRPEHYCDD